MRKTYNQHHSHVIRTQNPGDIMECQFVRVIVLAALCLLSAACWSSDSSGDDSSTGTDPRIRDALELERRGEFTEAARRYRELSDQGNAFAQYKLGYMYDAGIGVLEDDLRPCG